MKRHVDPQARVVSTLTCLFACVLLVIMLTGFTSPFNGVACRGQVISERELIAIYGPFHKQFRIPIFRDIPTNKEIMENTYVVDDYVYPEDWVYVVGVSYHWSKILLPGDVYYWIESRYITINPNEFTKPVGEQPNEH